MIIYLKCPKCAEHIKNNNSKPNFSWRDDIAAISITDNNIYLIDHIRYSHLCVVYLTNFKFDLLFESSLNAIKDNYYRDAVVSAATSLERFYEHCIEILVQKVDKKKKDEVWKFVRKHSERQLGAFCYLFLNSVDALPLVLEPKLVEIRNSVVHKGRFPTKVEAIIFAEAVCKIIENNYNMLLNTFSKEISEYRDNFKNKIKEEAEKFNKDEIKWREDIERKEKRKTPWVLEKTPNEQNINTYLFYNREFKDKKRGSIEDYLNLIEDPWKIQLT